MTTELKSIFSFRGHTSLGTPFADGPRGANLVKSTIEPANSYPYFAGAEEFGSVKAAAACMGFKPLGNKIHKFPGNSRERNHTLTRRDIDKNTRSRRDCAPWVRNPMRCQAQHAEKPMAELTLHVRRRKSHKLTPLRVRGPVAMGK